MSTPEDLAIDATAELAADRCDALHTEPEGRPDPECHVCQDRADQRRQDAADEGTACVAVLAGGLVCGFGRDEYGWHRNPDDSRAIDHEYEAPAGAD